MRRFFGLCLLLSAIALLNGSCSQKNTDEVLTADDCSGDVRTAQGKADLSGSSSLTVSTPLAAGDCTTLYDLWFRFKDSVDRTIFFTAPKVQATFSPTIPGYQPEVNEFAGNPPGYTGGGWWHIGFAPTPTSETGNKTIFTIQAKLYEGIEPVESFGQIRYRVSPN